VVFVRVGEDDPGDVGGPVPQVGEVGKHEIDTEHVGIGEHQAAVDHHDLAVDLETEAVASDLAETAEEDDAYTGHVPPRLATATRPGGWQLRCERIGSTKGNAMDTTELRSMQAPIKQRYRDNPDAGVVTLRARGNVGDESLTCSVETGRALVEAGLHPATGGDGISACSGDLLLQALVACAGVTLRTVATALGIELRGGEVRAEGEVDFRGTLGVDRDAPVGFREIRLSFDVETDADDDALAKLLELTERYCVVYHTLTDPPPMSTDLARG